jgi:hypothetical protein
MSITQDTNQAQSELQQNDKEKNLVLQRQMYERRLEQERREKETLQQRIEQFEKERQRPNNNHADDDDDTEPYVDRKTLKRELSKRDENLDERIDKRAEEKARSMVEQERVSAFLKQNSDFEQILTAEIIQKFAEKHPEIAEPMLEMPDNFARKKLLYQNIKALGLHKPPENKPSIQETIDKNRRSAFYQPSGSASPPYAPTADFSKAGQKNAYDKMQELIRNRRTG